MLNVIHKQKNNGQKGDCTLHLSIWQGLTGITKCQKECGEQGLLLIADRSVICVFTLGNSLSLQCEVEYSHALQPTNSSLYTVRKWLLVCVGKQEHRDLFSHSCTQPLVSSTELRVNSWTFLRKWTIKNDFQLWTIKVQFSK